MNDTSPDPQQPSGNGLKIGLIAAVLAVAVGAGLYAFLGSSGKQVAAAGSCSISNELRASLDGAAQGDVAAFQVVDDPSSITELAFNDKDGKPVSLADWKGRTVLLNLWATWCAPCRKEMPALDALERDLGGEKFQVVPISLDLGDDVKPKKFYSDIGLKDLPFFHDGSLETLNNLKKRGLAFGLPATLLVDTKGCVLGTLNGPAEWGGDDAKALVKSVM